MVSPVRHSKALARPVRQASHTLWVTLAGLLVAGLIAVFVISWVKDNQAAESSAPLAFSSVGPVLVQLKGFVLSATVAIQTRPQDAGWAQQNKAQISAILEKELAGVNPRTARSAAAIQKLQETLAAAVNEALKSDRVEQVLLTEFLVQAEDY